jgi:hypothetical protein
MLWPAFLTAGLMQLLVFAFVDPHELHWFGHQLAWSREAVYTVAFFCFWAVASAGCYLTWLLTVTPDAGTPEILDRR